MPEKEIKQKLKIEDLMKILRQTNKKSYNIDIIHLDNKKFKMYLEGKFMQTTKKMTLEDLALVVGRLVTTVTNLSSTVTNLSSVVEQGFKNVNERLDKVEIRLDNIERDVAELKVDVAAIKNCPTIKREINFLNNIN